MSKSRKVGSYVWRGPESLFISVRGGTDSLGKPIRHTKTVKGIKEGDERAAEKALATFISEIDKGKYKKPSKMTLREFSEWWKRDYVNKQLARGTAEVYRMNLDNLILPSLGDSKIDRIKPKHLLDFYDNLTEDGVRLDGKPGGYSPATIQKCHNILSSIFTCAVTWEEIETNPCERVKPPKVPKRKPVSLDKDPAKELLLALAKESLKYRVLTLIAACTGMRRGELLGIGDSTIDLKNCYITIDRASQHAAGGRVYLDDPKSKTSIRVVPFPPSIVPLIMELTEARNKQRNKCGSKWVDTVEVQGEFLKNDLLFTQWNGKPMHPNTVDTWFSKFKEENGFPDNLTFHGLRHTNITQLLKSGVDIGTVADMAGHSQKKTTWDYDDPLPSAQQEVANKIEDALSIQDTIPELLGKPVNIRRKRKSKGPNQKPE